MRDAAVDDVRPGHAALDGAQAGFHLGHHAGLERGEQVAERARAHLGDDLGARGPIGVETGYVGEHHELLGTECDGQRGSRGVGVDIVRGAGGIGCHRRDHGDAPVVQERGDELRSHLDDISHEAEVHLDSVDHGATPLGGEQVRILAGQADGKGAMRIDERDNLPLHLAREDHPDDIHGLRRGHAQATTEFTGDADAIEHRGDLRSAPMDDDGAQARETQEDDVLGEGPLECVVRHGVAAVLDHHGGSAEALKPRQRLGEDGGLVLRAHVEYAEFSWT